MARPTLVHTNLRQQTPQSRYCRTSCKYWTTSNTLSVREFWYSMKRKGPGKAQDNRRKKLLHPIHQAANLRSPDAMACNHNPHDIVPEWSYPHTSSGRCLYKMRCCPVGSPCQCRTCPLGSLVCQDPNLATQWEAKKRQTPLRRPSFDELMVMEVLRPIFFTA